jgi:zinc transporter 1/2/3
MFAGVTLGAQDELGPGLALFSGLLAHKAVEGLALGVSLAGSGIPPSRGLGILGTFALLTPVGIALGASLAGILDAPDSRFFEAASLALAGGTFLYIASLDLTRDEYLKPGSAWQKWACTALGVGLTALLAL